MPAEQTAKVVVMEVIAFPNGNVAAGDEHDRQIPELQSVRAKDFRALQRQLADKYDFSRTTYLGYFPPEARASRRPRDR